MGYRLHAVIPNKTVPDYEEITYLELGKQYDYKWDIFNDKWFGENKDSGLLHPDELQEFYEELVRVDKQEGDYKLYNLDVLKEFIDYAIENNYYMLFISF